MKKLIVFDLDGTLAESKGVIDVEMATLFSQLLSLVKVAVISGGDWPQFDIQLLSKLTKNTFLDNLTILPTSGTKFYMYSGAWIKKYSEDFTVEEKKKIYCALNESMKQVDFKVDQVWGEIIEDRGSQVTFSALGQSAPIEAKKQWDPDFKKRQKMKVILDKMIPEFAVNLGGTSSVDITNHGIDKAYGIQKLRDILGIPLVEILFVGDAIFPGGNDYSVKQVGVKTIMVKNPDETKRVMETLNALLGNE
jgi:hypothetical protein